MAKSKKDKSGISIDSLFLGGSSPKPKLNAEKVKAMESILKDEGLRNLSPREMENLIDAYKQGKKGK